MLIDPYRFAAAGLTTLTWFFAENLAAAKVTTGTPVSELA